MTRALWTRLATIGAILGLACPAAGQTAGSTQVGAGVRVSPEALARGRALMNELGWKDNVDPRLGQDFAGFTAENLFSVIYARDGLSPRERELIITAIIITQGGGEGLTPHFGHVLPRLGVTERNVRELIYTTCFYAGWPKCSSAEHYLNQIIKDNPNWPASLRQGGDKDAQSGAGLGVVATAAADLKTVTARYYQLVDSKDAAGLKSLLDPAATIIHSDGRVQPAGEFADGLARASLGVRPLGGFDDRLSGDTATSVGVIELSIPGQPPRQLRVTNVWRRIDGRWRLMHAQSTALPPAG